MAEFSGLKKYIEDTETYPVFFRRYGSRPTVTLIYTAGVSNGLLNLACIQAQPIDDFCGGFLARSAMVDHTRSPSLLGDYPGLLDVLDVNVPDIFDRSLASGLMTYAVNTNRRFCLYVDREDGPTTDVLNQMRFGGRAHNGMSEPPSMVYTGYSNAEVQVLADTPYELNLNSGNMATFGVRYVTIDAESNYCEECDETDWDWTGGDECSRCYNYLTADPDVLRSSPPDNDPTLQADMIAYGKWIEEQFVVPTDPYFIG